VLNTGEVVLGLSKSNPPYGVGVVRGVATGVVPALCNPNALLAVLPMVLVRAPPDVVCPILELLMPQPHEGSVGSAFYDASR
jgi:hypothetical protein